MTGLRRPLKSKTNGRKLRSRESERIQIHTTAGGIKTTLIVFESKTEYRRNFRVFPVSLSFFSGAVSFRSGERRRSVCDVEKKNLTSFCDDVCGWSITIDNRLVPPRNRDYDSFLFDTFFTRCRRHFKQRVSETYRFRTGSNRTVYDDQQWRIYRRAEVMRDEFP